jgi:hypothetical protein
MLPISSFLIRQTACIKSFLLACSLVFDEKMRQSTVLFWFGLRDVRILQIFFSPAVIQRTSVDSPALLETGLAEKVAICVPTSRMPKKKKEERYFLYKEAQKSFQILQISIKKLKTISV